MSLFFSVFCFDPKCNKIVTLLPRFLQHYKKRILFPSDDPFLFFILDLSLHLWRNSETLVLPNLSAPTLQRNP